MITDNFKKQPRKNETVVLLHGILRAGSSMKPVELYLENRGYDVLNISYPSNKMTLEALTDSLHEQISTADKFNNAAAVHFVTHSMGGILTRYYLAQHRPEHLGRVVMMGPPNTGSEFANFMSDHELLGPIFNNIFGPAGQQLRADYKHAANTMDIDYQVGVIAGTLSINPLAPMVFGDIAHDGIVPVSKTVIDGMADHILLPATHTMMMYNWNVLKEINGFLENGAFSATAKRLEL